MKKIGWVLSLMLLSSIGMTAQQSKLYEVGRDQASGFNQATFNRYELYYLDIRNLQFYNKPLVKLTILETKDLGALNLTDITLPKTFEVNVQLAMEKKMPKAYITIPHYIQEGNRVRELVKYTLTLEEVPTANKVNGARTYATNSVLSSGNFYKIAVGASGIYKLDYSFISSLPNVNVGSMNTANIRLYGNGGQMLSENNAVVPLDDLVENAIEVVDGNDGQLNPGDYILFYAPGPHTILKDSLQKAFTHQFNIYSEKSYYFLNFDKGPGKRIAMQSPVGASTIEVNSFNEFQFYERDSVNLGRFGKEFWADEMSTLPGRTLSKVINFSLPNIDASSPLVLSTRTGSVTRSAISNLKISVNGVLQQNINYEPFGENYYDPVIRVKEQTSTISSPSSTVSINAVFTPPTNDASAYIGSFEINARRNLVFNGYLNFADWNSVGAGQLAKYNISNVNTNAEVWDITNPLVPVKMLSTKQGSILSFTQDASILHRFVALDGSVVNTPTYIGKVDNQNLHQLSNIDYIVIAPSFLKAEAQRLADHHQAKRGYNYALVTPQEIYNEFSSGSQDISAIRNFIKMLYDKSTANHLPSAVLLFGDASYDYKDRLTNNTNLVPTHEANQSNDKILGYCSDDFYGFLDDNENLNDYSGTVINTLDIGVGRLPLSSVSAAAKMVNKIINYDGPNSFGPWKNNVTFNADNGDGARHLDDGEVMYNILNDSLPVFNAQKIYVDAFQLQSTPAGPRSPDANKAVLANMFNGTFLMNYNGHGGPGGWCDERIFSFNDINNLTNYNKLPLFITATCDFAPFDNPAYVSAGETLVNKPDGGAIALMTTTQLVFADKNQIMNANYMKKGFSKSVNGKYPNLGDAFRLSKNMTYASFVDENTAANFRKFALLGDPGLPLAIPPYKVFTDSINGISVNVQYDTLKALGKYTISGHVSDEQGNFLSNFNGVVYPTIFDKAKKLTTLQSVGDPKREYYVQNNAVYKGKASVKNGRFSFTFVMPKDINYEIAKGKISYYANNETVDGSGYDKNIYVGGSSGIAVSDNVGPTIKAYMNDEKFVNGGITPSDSKLLVKLFDDNGINYSGNSIGHDITAVLDNNPQYSYVLNSFFEADLDDYRSGMVRFPLNYLSEGEHTIQIRAWDVLNNSSEVTLRFVVVGTEEGQLAHVLNYPNPFSTTTQFMFEHNMPNQTLNISVQVMTVSGKVVKTLRTMMNTEGTRICALDWDGKDEYGDPLGNGVYLYKLHVKSSAGVSVTKLERLVILR